MYELCDEDMKDEGRNDRNMKSTLTTFGATQRLKTDKCNWLGPGR